MSNTIRIRVDELVSYEGENWKILHVEDFMRVLATRISNGKHDFLPIAELKTPVRDESSKSKTPPGGESTGKQEEISLLTDNARRLKERKVRQVSSEGKLTQKKQEKAYPKALSEFQSALHVLNAPRDRRAALIDKMCKAFGISVATAYRHIQIVSMTGSADALLRAVRNDKGQFKISREVLEIIQENLRLHRFIPEPKSMSDILDLVNGECQSKTLEGISLTSLRNFEHETSLKKRLESQGRKKQVKDLFGSKAGELPDKDYPLCTVQIDHTPIQVCLVDETDRQPIDDPWLTLVIDCYSRMVLGFYLTFDAPSTLSTGVAMAHAFLPKEDYLRHIGVKGEWPCWGFPDIILVDNAAELNGRMMHDARRQYRFDLRDRPVGSPNFGGHVESAFRTFMYEFKSIPGTKFSNPMERGEYDSEGRAILTIAEFEHLFTEFLVNDYHLAEHTGKGMDRFTPLMKWKQGIFEGDIMPPTGLPERPADPMALRISLLPFEMRTIRNATVQLFGEEYHNPALTLIGDAIDLNKPIKERLYEVRYDPRDISKVWLLNPETHDYLELAFADLRKGSISLWEHNTRKRRRGNPSEQFLGQRYESKLKREEIKDKAAKRTKRQRLAEETERRRAQGALVKPPPVSNRPIQTPSSKRPLDPERLKALREKVRSAAVNPSIRRKKSDDAM